MEFVCIEAKTFMEMKDVYKRQGTDRTGGTLAGRVPGRRAGNGK